MAELKHSGFSGLNPILSQWLQPQGPEPGHLNRVGWQEPRQTVPNMEGRTYRMKADDRDGSIERKTPVLQKPGALGSPRHPQPYIRVAYASSGSGPWGLMVDKLHHTSLCTSFLISNQESNPSLPFNAVLLRELNAKEP